MRNDERTADIEGFSPSLRHVLAAVSIIDLNILKILQIHASFKVNDFYIHPMKTMAAGRGLF